MFVDSLLLEVGQVAPEDQEKIDATLGVNDRDVTTLLDEVGATLVITRGASVVLAPARSGDPAYRVRQPLRRPGARGAGACGWRGGEPCVCAAAGADPVFHARGGELP